MCLSPDNRALNSISEMNLITKLYAIELCRSPVIHPNTENTNAEKYYGRVGYRGFKSYFHRNFDLPSSVHLNGGKFWYHRGKRHRLIGPAFLSEVDGIAKGYFQWELRKDIFYKNISRFLR